MSIGWTIQDILATQVQGRPDTATRTILLRSGPLVCLKLARWHGTTHPHWSMANRWFPQNMQINIWIFPKKVDGISWNIQFQSCEIIQLKASMNCIFSLLLTNTRDALISNLSLVHLKYLDENKLLQCQERRTRIWSRRINLRCHCVYGNVKSYATSITGGGGHPWTRVLHFRVSDYNEVRTEQTTLRLITSIIPNALIQCKSKAGLSKL